MKIQLKSDLHWENTMNHTYAVCSPERNDAYVHPDADVLVLAGDIINAMDYQIDYLLHKFKDVKIPILYVPGNHEYWHTTYREGRELLEKKLSGTNITLLDQDWYIPATKDGKNDVVFVGATLWTSLANPQKEFIAKQTRDFKEIKNLTTQAWHYRHLNDIDRIEGVLDLPAFFGAKKVVVSHYLPSHNSVPEKFKGHEMNCIFVAEDAERLIAEYEPELWLHGHTHDSNDYMLGKTRVISNPKGRLKHTGGFENWNYNNALVIEI
jgi:predicted phosphodiesterase